jgi:hypothetical protein
MLYPPMFGLRKGAVDLDHDDVGHDSLPESAVQLTKARERLAHEHHASGGGGSVSHG